ncbi:response regulator [Pedobacter nyackensis]|uniref:response regulator transcription factor n=1 Tax=Pedobacter nyackensis TaxID=475255 RepID=UPI0029317132|nr:response regulator [Pedobacter nyackensis]
MSKCIYLVEDDDDIRFIVEYVLIEEGYEVKAFGTASEFHKGLSTNKIDLIILDVMLPDGNGIDICRKLKTNNQTSHIPVVIMSAHAAEKSILEEACADGFINKPFDLKDLTNQIKTHLKT